MRHFSSIFLVSLIGIAQSRPVSDASPATSSTPQCTTIVLPIKAAANNTVFPPFPSDGNYGQYLGSFNASTLPKQEVTGTYDISATYCEPTVKVKGREDTVQLLLHAVGSTKEYWSGSLFPSPNYPSQYSYTSHATSQGYTTLAIDRLGNGASAHPDPVKDVQAPLQVATIVSILTQLRTGTLPQITTQYPKVVLVGHSYGAILARTIAALFPTIKGGADAYILMGISADLPGIAPAIANFGATNTKNMAPGYLTVSPEGLRKTVYGEDGTFDPAILAWDQDNLEHDFAIGEVAGAGPAIVSQFEGPVMAVVGRQDVIACGKGSIFDKEGKVDAPDCGVGEGSAADSQRRLFPEASVFEIYAVAKTGHWIGTAYSAEETFGAVSAWLGGVGF